MFARKYFQERKKVVSIAQIFEQVVYSSGGLKKARRKKEAVSIVPWSVHSCNKVRVNANAVALYGKNIER